jgi:DNA (cytosine-5)-methyltransferase 1
MSIKNVEVVSLFAGPGGWCEGLRTVAPHLHQNSVGVEYDPDTCATRNAAGHRTIAGDVRTVNRDQFHGITGLIGSPPCPTFSNGGRRTGRGADYQHALDAICCLSEGCDCNGRWLADTVQDERTALLIEPLRWIVELQPEWVLLEQVPALEYAFEDIAAELYAADWEWADVAVLDAADFGAPQHRQRVFLAAHRTQPRSLPRPTHGPGRAHPYNTPAAALGVHGTIGFPRRNDTNDGGIYRARDMRTTDRPAFTLTEKVRSWKLVPDGPGEVRQLTDPEIATLAGFRPNYPFQGSRTSRCLQAANAVCPLVAGALIESMLPQRARLANAA